MCIQHSNKKTRTFYLSVVTAIFYTTQQKGSLCLKYDMEVIVQKIHAEFSSSTTNYCALKEFFEFTVDEFVEMLSHGATRWLTLLPALLKNGANKIIFSKQKKCKPDFKIVSRRRVKLCLLRFFFSQTLGPYSNRR